MATGTLPASAVGFVPLPVTRVDRLTEDSVAVTFSVAQAQRDRFRFSPGQHLTLRREVGGQDLRRTYSICTSCAGGVLRIGVRRVDDGTVSGWLVDALRPGDVVQVLPPAGRFGPRLDPARTRRYGLLGAGSGITPLLSIAASVLDVEPGSDVLLVYGNRTQADVMFLDELADLKDRFPERLQVLHVLSREEQESELLSGRLDRDRLTRMHRAGLLDGVDEWFLCGPFGLVTQARQTLLDLGADEADVHVELFHADPLPPRPRSRTQHGAAQVTVVLHGRATTVEVDGDRQTVLDAVLAQRPDAPYACRGGVCGTCRARLVTGQVTMDVNYALEPDELAAGVVLTCQSRPATAEVRLEFR